LTCDPRIRVLLVHLLLEPSDWQHLTPAKQHLSYAAHFPLLYSHLALLSHYKPDSTQAQEYGHKVYLPLLEEEKKGGETLSWILWMKGKLSMNGLGMKKDEKEGFKFYQIAAEKGNAWGQAAVGHCFMNGFGIGKDEKQGVEWYKLASSQGLARAQNNLGTSYREGRGVRKDENKAVEFYRQAVAQGHATGQYNLGRSYDFGLGGLTLSTKDAFRFYWLSAEQGDEYAQYCVGWAYESGRGVVKNVRKALRWYQLSAKRGEEEVSHKAAKKLKEVAAVC